MKITSKTPLLFALLALTSCTVLKPMSSIDASSASASTSVARQQWKFTLHYDYGNYRKDEITLLFDDCIPFFSLKDYGLGDALAGDLITMEYTGGFAMHSTYPATAVLGNDFKIGRVWTNPTSYFEVNQEDIANHWNYSYDHPYVITDLSTLAFVGIDDYVKERDSHLLYATEGKLTQSGGCLAQPRPIEAFYSDIPGTRRLSY
jgi:hypothetical protein